MVHCRGCCRQYQQSEASTRELTDRTKKAEREAARLRLEVQTLQVALREGDVLRRQLHNTIQELRGNIRVLCRVRPLLKSEGWNGAIAKNPHQGVFVFPPPTHFELGDPVSVESSKDKKSNRFVFDKVGLLFSLKALPLQFFGDFPARFSTHCVRNKPCSMRCRRCCR